MKAHCPHGRKWFQSCDKCDWTSSGLWSSQPAGDSIMDDVLKMIETLERDRTYRPDGSRYNTTNK